LQIGGEYGHTYKDYNMPRSLPADRKSDTPPRGSPRQERGKAAIPEVENIEDDPMQFELSTRSIPPSIRKRKGLDQSTNWLVDLNEFMEDNRAIVIVINHHKEANITKEAKAVAHEVLSLT
jgi:hypothetical protein